MKLNNKGVASKEFLTIIIIVCMILVILVPTILNVVEFSGKKVLMNNVIIFRSEVDRTLLSYATGGEDIIDGCYYIMQDGNVCLGEYSVEFDMCYSDSLVIELTGEKPNAGTLEISSNKVSDIHNIRMENFFINIDDAKDYYISEEPRAQIVCR